MKSFWGNFIDNWRLLLVTLFRFDVNENPLLFRSDLNHLEGGEIFLPPQILLHVRAKGSEEVVGVHDHVHQTVEGATEGLVATGQPAAQCPAKDGHDAVVNHLKM